MSGASLCLTRGSRPSAPQAGSARQGLGRPRARGEVAPPPAGLTGRQRWGNKSPGTRRSLRCGGGHQLTLIFRCLSLASGSLVLLSCHSAVCFSAQMSEQSDSRAASGGSAGRIKPSPALHAGLCSSEGGSHPENAKTAPPEKLNQSDS